MSQPVSCRGQSPHYADGPGGSHRGTSALLQQDAAHHPSSQPSSSFLLVLLPGSQKGLQGTLSGQGGRVVKGSMG